MVPTRDADDRLRRPVPEASDPPSGDPRSAVPPLALHLVADTITPSIVRDRLRSWLSALSWPQGQLDDIVLAVSEAVSNAVEHAYPTGADLPPGHVDVHAEADSGGRPHWMRRVHCTVHDHGRWRPPPADDENRRRGIPIMRACMDTVTIEMLTDDDGRPAGTKVTMSSAAAPGL